MRLVWMALLAVLMVAVAPTVSRLLGAGDPARAAVLAEICSVGMTSVAAPASDAPDPEFTGDGADCPMCLSAAVAFAWPEPDRRPDHAPAAQHLRPAMEPLYLPGPAPVWRSAPPRAPPAAPRTA